MLPLDYKLHHGFLNTVCDQGVATVILRPLTYEAPLHHVLSHATPHMPPPSSAICKACGSCATIESLNQFSWLGAGIYTAPVIPIERSSVRYEVGEIRVLSRQARCRLIYRHTPLELGPPGRIRRAGISQSSLAYSNSSLPGSNIMSNTSSPLHNRHDCSAGRPCLWRA